MMNFTLQICLIINLMDGFVSFHLHVSFRYHFGIIFGKKDNNKCVLCCNIHRLNISVG